MNKTSDQKLNPYRLKTKSQMSFVIGLIMSLFIPARTSAQYIHILNCKENNGTRDTVFLFNPYSVGAVYRIPQTRLPEGVYAPYNSTIPDSEVVAYDTLIYYAAEKCEVLGTEAYARIVLAMIKEPYNYIKHNLKYPENLSKRIHGYVTVGFTIKSGETAKNLRIIHSLNPMLDAEAVRLVSEIPASQWLIPQPREYNHMIFWGTYQCRMLIKF
ncbi:MAG: energy transducer TonB [Taibaiella sp.]|nr:energy transducer TonB [Taibaiella sp.]